MRYAARVDANHRSICEALVACGWLVKDCHQYPGFVDAVAQRRGVTRLIEIKAKRGKLTRSQADMIASGFDVKVLRTVEDAVALT